MRPRARVYGSKAGSAACVAIQEAIPRVIAQALRDPMRDRVLVDAKALVSRRTGALYDALDVTPVRFAGGRMTDRLAAVGLRIGHVRPGAIGTGGGKNNMRPRSYWHLVEFGTARTAAKPYLRPSFDRNEKHLVEDFKRICAAGIERATKRARTQARGQYRGAEEE